MTSGSSGKAPVMLGLEMPDVQTWSERVVTALGQNPGAFTGPGTNTYLVGTGRSRILLDTGDGRLDYLPVLEQALEHAGGVSIQEIVLTHGHPDHIGGAASVMERHGRVRIAKRGHEPFDAAYALEIHEIGDGDVIETEGATLRALHTPGHAPDHLCFVLEEECAIFTGDNVLGVGTTVIPPGSGNLGDYMISLARLLDESPRMLFPAHGPRIDDGVTKIREYIDHRLEREEQILETLRAGVARIHAMVEIIYAAYPKGLHAAAGQSVASHLLKLEAEGRVRRTGGGPEPTEADWELA
jgi:glyoxylase-like metal-dependent hydrolase (beta-lactamase superfamily II)